MEKNRDVIVALDFKGREEALKFLDMFKEAIYVKVGMELFYAAGPDILKEIRERGHRIFLDLKFHDIPNTVAGATRSALEKYVEIFNVHAAGGIKMMEEAVKEKERINPKALAIAVTQLTSTSQEMMEEELLIKEPLKDVVLHYAQNAKKAGMDGIVCSPLEVPYIKENLGKDFITVTPGIRPSEGDKGDQKRVTTPEDARKLGSDYIVVGRPITKAENPLKAYKEIRKEFLGEDN